MKLFKTIIRNIENDCNEIKEVKGFNYDERLFIYKKEDDNYYYLVDKLTGFSLGKEVKMKLLKEKAPALKNKMFNLINANPNSEEYYNDLVENFKRLAGDNNE